MLGIKGENPIFAVPSKKADAWVAKLVDALL